MKRILAIDFGTKKCGFAISDPLQIISQPLKIIRYETIQNLINEIKLIINENSPIEKIIIGLPKNIDGSISNTGNQIIAFKNILIKEIPSFIEIILFDEKYSSKSADETMSFLNYSNKKKKDSRDILAAQNILENYLLFNSKK